MHIFLLLALQEELLNNLKSCDIWLPKIFYENNAKFDNFSWITVSPSKVLLYCRSVNRIFAQGQTITCFVKVVLKIDDDFTIIVNLHI